MVCAFCFIYLFFEVVIEVLKLKSRFPNIDVLVSSVPVPLAARAEERPTTGLRDRLHVLRPALRRVRRCAATLPPCPLTRCRAALAVKCNKKLEGLDYKTCEVCAVAVPAFAGKHDPLHYAQMNDFAHPDDKSSTNLQKTQASSVICARASVCLAPEAGGCLACAGLRVPRGRGVHRFQLCLLPPRGGPALTARAGAALLSEYNQPHSRGGRHL